MYDKKTARKLIDTYRTYGKPVRHGEIARKLNMAKATFSRRLNPSPKYRGLGFTEDDILKMAEFLNIPDADRSTLLQCYGHASRHDRRQANTQSDTLPVPPVPFIGRVKELAEARELLSQTRVLTVTGVGGGGKTRFVIALARAIQLEKLREVGFVDLAPIENGADVPQAVARALHVEAPEELVLERVGEYL